MVKRTVLFTNGVNVDTKSKKVRQEEDGDSGIKWEKKDEWKAYERHGIMRANDQVRLERNR